MYVSLRDLIAWEGGLRARAILSAASWDAIFTPVTLSSGRRHPYGFGWRIERLAGQLMHHHGGAWQGFKATIVRLPEDDVTVIVLANLAQANTDRLARRILASQVPTVATSPTSSLFTTASSAAR
jgi:CubicO group peptidase (beta-lactamase class C family)